MPKTALSLNFSKPGPRRIRYGPSGPGWPAVDETTNVEIERRVESRSTVNTAGFRATKGSLQREDLPMNPFSYSLRQTHEPYGIWERWSPSWKERRDGFIPGETTNFEPRGIVSSDRSRIADEALLASLQDLKNQKVNIGVTLAEGKETVGLFLDASKRLGTSYRAFKRGDIKGGLDALGNSRDSERILRDLERIRRRRRGQPRKNNFSASSDVLAAQLGWKPLLGDVYNYAELLASRAHDPVRVKSITSRSHRWSGRIGPPEYWNGVDAHRREFGIHTVKYVYYFKGDRGVVPTLASLGLTNPISWLYELTALSFVVDYVIKIGDFIDALDATLGLTFEKGCKTTFEKCRVRYRCVGSGVVGSEQTYMNSSASKLHVDVVRTPLTGFPAVPPLVVGSGLNWSRGVTVGALIRQYFKK